LANSSSSALIRYNYFAGGILGNAPPNVPSWNNVFPAFLPANDDLLQLGAVVNAINAAAKAAQVSQIPYFTWEVIDKLRVRESVSFGCSTELL